MFDIRRAIDDYDTRTKLEKFRKNFLYLTSDGRYPPERQSALFQWCQRGGVDWEAARRFVAEDAAALFRRAVQRVVADGRLQAEEVAELRRLQRRLALGDEECGADRLLDLVERRLLELIVERAAYLSAPAAAASLRAAIEAYQLPEDRSARLLAAVARQAELARLLAGDLPVVAPPVTLYRDEACHLSVKLSCVIRNQPAQRSGRALLLVTSERLLILTPGLGAGGRWAEVGRMQFDPPAAFHVQVRGVQASLFFGPGQDAQLIATLLVGAHRRYCPSAAQPERPPKRLG